MPEGQPSIPAIVIRRAGTEDAPDIVSLLYESFVEYKSLYTVEGFSATAISEAEILDRMREGPVLVATMNGTIVGTVAIVTKGESLYIRGMAVRPSNRGQHIGDQLLTDVEDFAVRHGIWRLFLSTTPFLTRAIRLYERFGFHRIDEKPQALFGTPLFRMEKLLPLSFSRSSHS
ncbi:MAG TPA: GNAT family N-acetyltransferase [Pyrinomonadaceae bacterium]|nr:GNAT family N-acetyltransferase [Pyrinomonadaceae bacterium]